MRDVSLNKKILSRGKERVLSNIVHKTNLPELHTDAEAGDPSAQFLLGKALLHDNRDLSGGLYWIRQSAANRNLDGITALGRCYYLGLGVQKDYQIAAQLFLKAAYADNDLAQLALSHCYNNGRGVAKDDSIAFIWALRSAEQGNAQAQLHVGSDYLYGKTRTRNALKAVEWLTKAAEQRNADAQFFLAACCIGGIGIPQDDSKAISWATKAALQNQTDAQMFLADCYQDGIGVAKDEKKSFFWLKRAAESGDKVAEHRLSTCYECGIGTEQNTEETFYWLTTSALHGHAPAQYNLGLAYLLGEVMEPNPIEAKKWIQKAADQEFEEAMNCMQKCFPSESHKPLLIALWSQSSDESAASNRKSTVAILSVNHAQPEKRTAIIISSESRENSSVEFDDDQDFGGMGSGRGHSTSNDVRVARDRHFPERHFQGQHHPPACPLRMPVSRLEQIKPLDP